MKGKKNDYSITFFKGKKKRLFLEYVHDTDKAFKWLKSKKIDWDYCNLYERRTRVFLRRIYFENVEF